MLPENWDVVRCFVAAQTQWRRAGPDGTAAVGLDYAGARCAAEGLGVEWRAVFAGMRVMEIEWMRALSERRGT